MDTARVLRAARRRAGLTQRGLAEGANVPQPHIARIESGVAIPRVDTLDRLLEICGEALEALPRPGIGVDRTMYPAALSLSPRQRIQQAARNAAHNNRVLGMARGEAPVENYDFLAALEQFTRGRIRFVLVGGVAALAHGSNIVTNDLDLCCRWDRSNLERIVSTLRELGASHHGSRARMIRASTLRRMTRTSFDTSCGPIDILGSPPGFLRGYEELERAAEDVDLGGFSIRVPNLDDLIRMKRATGRSRDLAMAEELGALRDEIDARAAEERRRRKT